MELIELTPAILNGLKKEGYRYFIHTQPTVEEERALECCELDLVKYVPAKNIAEAEDIEGVYTKNTYRISLDEANHEVEDAEEGKILSKIFIEKRFIAA